MVDTQTSTNITTNKWIAKFFWGNKVGGKVQHFLERGAESLTAVGFRKWVPVLTIAILQSNPKTPCRNPANGDVI